MQEVIKVTLLTDEERAKLADPNPLVEAVIDRCWRLVEGLALAAVRE